MLSVLLHFHQPDYRDPRTGEPVMPWVRLHATRGYRDVLRTVRDTGAPVTVNLVGVLLDQLDHYARGGTDAWLRVAEPPPEALSPGERAWMVEHFFAANPRVFDWYPAYGRLRARARAGERLDDAALRDLQVWAQLAWFGYTALGDWPELGELRRKGEGYTEAEKARVLAIQRRILGEIPELLPGLPEVSASPMYHPILPLLVDTSHASRAHPGLPDPGFRDPEDALAQLVEGRRRVEAAVGRPVDGLWPSEGSVSPEAMEVAAAAGFRWFASDEAVLARSEHDPGGPPGPWRVGAMVGVFRDRELSDRIGFRYADADGVQAVHDLVASAGSRPVLLALDGENPWESYPDAGRRFLDALCACTRLRTVGDLADDPPVGRVVRLHTGSWVFGHLGIWIGHEEDRDAWRLLARCHADWVAAGRPEAARRHVHAAEGSDWFWWYGEDFSTSEADTFDALFRGHLVAAWRTMGIEPPPEAFRPVRRRGAEAEGPVGPLGEGDDWFTWRAAGRLPLRGGAMATREPLPRALLYGERGGGWALRLLPARPGWTVVRGDDRVPFADGAAWIADGALTLVLEGPDGVRLPEAGAFLLPRRRG